MSRVLAPVATAAIFVWLMLLMPWESIKRGQFVDRQNYIDNLVYQPPRLSYISLDGWISYVSNEYLWHSLMSYLMWDKGIPINDIFLSITALSLIALSLCASLRGGVIALILLVSPLVVDFTFSQYRMALAASVLYMAIIVRQRWVYGVAMVVAPLIHTASLIFISIYAISLAASKYMASIRSDVLLRCVAAGSIFVIGLSLSLILGPLRYEVLHSFGDRRAGYHDMASSAAYLIVWAGLLFVFLVQNGRFLIRENVFFSGCILACLTCNILTGAYSTRLLVVSLPMIVSSVVFLPEAGVMRIVKVGSIVCLLLYTALLWYYWIRA